MRSGLPRRRGAPSLAELRSQVGAAGSPLYVGGGVVGPAFADVQQALLVLGPPRSGKTSSVVVPNVLLAPGAVVSTSTKPDVLAATFWERRDQGTCWLFDPTGTTPIPPGLTPLRWSPVDACRDWDMAIRTTHAMTRAARPAGYAGEQAHWTERAEAMLAPLMHAAAVSDAGIDQVLRWVNRHDLEAAFQTLAMQGRDLSADILAGLIATDQRELSGIFSTASGVLAAYRSEQAQAWARDSNFNPRTLLSSRDTVYICASGRDQALISPIVVGLLEQIRAGAYEATATTYATGRGPGPPITLVLDEAANIAPIPDLPGIVAEGGSQGLSTLACFQDLSQAWSRWGPASDGFMTLFGSKVILGGIRDLRTLEIVSRAAGEHEVPHNSVSRGPFLLGGRYSTITRSTRRQPRLPVDAVANLPPNEAILIRGARSPTVLALTPWFNTVPFTEARRSIEVPRPSIEAPRRRKALGRGI